MIDSRKNYSWKDFNKSLTDKRIFIFGVGRACQEFLDRYGEKYKIEEAYDNSSKKWGTSIRGIQVKNPSELGRYVEKENIVILITSILFVDEIFDQLAKAGFGHVYSWYVMEAGFPGYKIRRFLNVTLFGERGIFNNYIIFHLSAVSRICRVPFSYKKYASLQTYKKCHRGKRCFIVASGPSITIEDLQTLKECGEITFSVNNMYRLYNKTDWRPDYYVVYDPFFMNTFSCIESEVNLEQLANKKIFLNYMFEKLHLKSDKIEYYPISFLGHLIKAEEKSMIYSKNLIWGLYCLYTVTNICIQLADYMGFEEIYLLGADCNYNGIKQRIVDEEVYDANVKKMGFADISYRKMIRGYRFVNKHKRKNLKIYNATRGGLLEVFPRKDFDSLFEEEYK